MNETMKNDNQTMDRASGFGHLLSHALLPLKAVSHALGQFQVALHVIGKVDGAHRRLLRFGYFPHLALRHFLVKLI
jgi:hypothetical protein